MHLYLRSHVELCLFVQGESIYMNLWGASRHCWLNGHHQFTASYLSSFAIGKLVVPVILLLQFVLVILLFQLSELMQFILQFVVQFWSYLNYAVRTCCSGGWNWSSEYVVHTCCSYWSRSRWNALQYVVHTCCSLPLAVLKQQFILAVLLSELGVLQYL